ncbi:MAG TPA: SDR family oxidoreductase [Polyangia bacterium]|jgi:NAD(P)-dependent dehydrogenase (short-subunit alcohol dehydrogenase family)|nr:SDR family oxidoreductase [Polyangia bacterium]
MKLDKAVVLITGANRGLGLAFAREALARGARTVYAGARDPSTVTSPGVVPIKLDVTDPADIAAAAERCGDVTLVVNNAGIADSKSFLAAGAIDSARRLLETNFFGTWRVSAAFAPVLEANGGGALLNVLSIASWINSPALAVYGATKSAAWALTNGLRHELRGQKTQVLALHVGFIDTDLVRGLDVPKTPPEVVAQRAFDALAAGADEVMADEITKQVKQGLSATPGVYTQPLSR